MEYYDLLFYFNFKTDSKLTILLRPNRLDLLYLFNSAAFAPFDLL